MKVTINEQQMETQITEMWHAIADIPDNDPGKSDAWNQAAETENKLRKQFANQENLRDAAADLLDSNIRLLRWISLKHGNSNLTDAAIENARKLIGSLDINNAIIVKSKKIYLIEGGGNGYNILSIVVAESNEQAIELTRTKLLNEHFDDDFILSKITITDVRINSLSESEVVLLDNFIR